MEPHRIYGCLQPVILIALAPKDADARKDQGKQGQCVTFHLHGGGIWGASRGRASLGHTLNSQLTRNRCPEFVLPQVLASATGRVFPGVWIKNVHRFSKNRRQAWAASVRVRQSLVGAMLISSWVLESHACRQRKCPWRWAREWRYLGFCLRGHQRGLDYHSE